MQQVPQQKVLEFLLNAPKIMNEVQAVAWQYLQPAHLNDGTVFLEWQPPQRQTQFASDGFVWGGPESMYNLSVNGYV